MQSPLVILIPVVLQTQLSIISITNQILVHLYSNAFTASQKLDPSRPVKYLAQGISSLFEEEPSSTKKNVELREEIEV